MLPSTNRTAADCLRLLCKSQVKVLDAGTYCIDTSFACRKEATTAAMDQLRQTIAQKEAQLDRQEQIIAALQSGQPLTGDISEPCSPAALDGGAAEEMPQEHTEQQAGSIDGNSSRAESTQQ